MPAEKDTSTPQLITHITFFPIFKNHIICHTLPSLSLSPSHIFTLISQSQASPKDLRSIDIQAPPTVMAVSKASQCCLFVVALLITAAAAADTYTNHTVGGDAGWFFNSDTAKTSADYNAWAAKQTFNLGDFLSMFRMFKLNLLVGFFIFLDYYRLITWWLFLWDSNLFDVINWIEISRVFSSFHESFNRFFFRYVHTFFGSFDWAFIVVDCN